MSGNDEVEAGRLDSVPTGTEAEIVETIEYINERSRNLVRYSNKLSEAIKTIDKYIETIGPKAGIFFTDPEPFWEERDEYWGNSNWRLSIRKDWGLYAVSNADEIPNVLLIEGRRVLKKQAIIRLPEFLRLYADELEKLEKEYEDISRKANAMAEILSREVA